MPLLFAVPGIIAAMSTVEVAIIGGTALVAGTGLYLAGRSHGHAKGKAALAAEIQATRASLVGYGVWPSRALFSPPPPPPPRVPLVGNRLGLLSQLLRGAKSLSAPPA